MVNWRYLMTKLINLYGAPSSGKSILAAKIYFNLALEGKKIELVREVAKEWAWQDRKITPHEQIAILGEQLRQESLLFDKVDYIVTDSPIYLGAFYFEYYFGANFCKDMVEKYYDWTLSLNDIEIYNFYLNNDFEPATEGRFQSKIEIYKLNEQLKAWLPEKLKITEVDSDLNMRVNQIKGIIC